MIPFGASRNDRSRRQWAWRCPVAYGCGQGLPLNLYQHLPSNIPSRDGHRCTHGRRLGGPVSVGRRRSPRPAPTRPALAADALRTRLAVLFRLGEVAPTLRRAATELKPSAAGRAPLTTLKAPTGGRRQLAVTRLDLAGLRHTAHAHGATINAVVLTAMLTADVGSVPWQVGAILRMDADSGLSLSSQSMSLPSPSRKLIQRVLTFTRSSPPGLAGD